MKHFFLLTLSLITGYILYAQTGSAKQVKWDFATKKLSENTYEIKITANIGGNYHMYAQDAGTDGPVATEFTFTGNPLVLMNGKVKEVGKKVTKKEEVWGGKGIVNYYEKSVEFVQVVKLKGNAKTNVTGKVEFMVCNDSQCLPPSEVEFKIPVGG